jgi:hypothetical protein
MRRATEGLALPPAIARIRTHAANRPRQIYNIHDEINGKDNIVILEKYINDLYNLFLRKISNYITIQSVTSEDSIKLQALLQEIIKVKDLIEKASSPDIMNE